MADVPALSTPTDATLPIGAVVAEVRRTFPDVSHSSLRFLEREGLLMPTRTPGGHRLYSMADVARIVQIKRWQQQGLSLDEIRHRLARLERLPVPSALADAFLAQVLEGNLAAAYQTVLTADDVGLPLPRLLGEVLGPALVEVGRRWETGDLLVAQEKEVSELARDLIAELSFRHARPASAGPTIVAGCVEGERHELGLRMICGQLRASGYEVHYLGADVASRFLLDAVRLRRPDAVLLSARVETTLGAIRDAIYVLTTGLAPGRVPDVIVGGQVAIAHGDTLRSWGAMPVPHEGLVESVQAIMAALPLPEEAS